MCVFNCLFSSVTAFNWTYNSSMKLFAIFVFSSWSKRLANIVSYLLLIIYFSYSTKVSYSWRLCWFNKYFDSNSPMSIRSFWMVFNYSSFNLRFILSSFSCILRVSRSWVIAWRLLASFRFSKLDILSFSW